MKQKKILITGSNGLLGQKLIELLVTEASVLAFASTKGGNRLPFHEGYQYVEMDVTHAQQVEQVVAEIRPDVIIHTAAMTNVDQCEMEKEACWRLNVTAVEILIDVCRKYDVFLQHLSTDFVFDGKSGPYVEEDLPNPISFYGWSKYAAEKAVLSSDVRFAITRTVLVYGIAHDMSRSNIILWVKNSLEEGRPIKVVTDQYRTPTLAEDLATGCCLIALKEAKGIFHISGKDFLTPYDMSVMTARHFNLNLSLISPTDASTFAQPARRPPRTGFILTKAQQVLGYEPHSFKEGIELVAKQIGG